MRRPRGPGGRFLTAEEIAAQQKAAAENADTSNFQNPNPSAEERKALKASESAAAAAVASSNLDSTETNFSPMEVLGASNDSNTNASTEYRAFTDQVQTGSTTPTQESFPAQSQATGVPQYMDMNAGSSAAGNTLQ